MIICLDNTQIEGILDFGSFHERLRIDTSDSALS